MENFTLILLFIALIALIFLSAFFSSSETGMMAINRYRLRHLVRTKNRAATRTAQLLDRPDRLLSVILLGNTFANILASSLATIIAIHLWGEIGVAIATFLLTLLILIFAEVIPKTVAAIHSQRVALMASLPLKFLLKALYPVVWLINTIANGFLKLFRVKIKKDVLEHLTSEELSTLVKEAGGKIPATHQDILLAVLDLEKITVDDIMLPRNHIVGIDLNDVWDSVVEKITRTQHTRIPIFKGSIDNIKGILHVRSILEVLGQNKLDKKTLLEALNEPYFIPENTPLHIQLLNFRKLKERTALVVDEYGDIQGLVTLEDILEEIVGEFTTSVIGGFKEVLPQPDGAYIVDGGMNIRDLNRTMDWSFSISGPKTLSGLIIEYLEMIPPAGICLRISGYPIEVLRVKGNRVQKAKVYPHLRI